MPTKIAIIGLAKSGTTALYQAIKSALPEDTACVFEPKTPRELAYLRQEECEYALTKLMLTSMGPCAYKESDFEKNIVIVRDPRDVLVSSLLYRFNRLDIINNEPRFKDLQAQFLAKEQNPSDIPLTHLMELFNPDGYHKSQLVNYERLIRLLNNANNTVVFPYASLAAGDFSTLDDYLGLNLSKPIGLKGWVGKISRKGQSGDWKNWFTASDVAFFQEHIDPILERFDLPKDWELNSPQLIEPAHCSEYITRLAKARKSDPLINKPEKMQLEDLESAASDGKAIAMYRLATKIISEEGPTDKAIDLLRRGALLGHRSCAVKAAGIHRTAGAESKALASLRIAVDLGHAPSAFVLGRLLQQPGPEQDLPEAATVLLHGAKQGDTHCMRALSEAYRDGLGVEHNPYIAAQWKQRARGARLTLPFNSKKVRKFFRDPTRFWQDYRSKQRLIAEAKKDKAITAHKSISVRQTDSSITNFNKSFDRATALSAMQERCEVFTTLPNTPRIDGHCFTEEIPTVLARAIGLSNHTESKLTLTIKNQRHNLDSSNMYELIWFCQKAQSFRLVFGRTGSMDVVISVGIWERATANEFLCRTNNAYTRRLSGKEFDGIYDADTRVLNLASLFTYPVSSQCDFPIDIVYSWVNHEDEVWRRLLGTYRPFENVDWSRYHSVDELRYSLRSLHKYADWVRNIYIVTNCAPPSWLKDHDKVKVISHEEIFPPSAALPSFSSHAIESCLARIDGLAEHFIYFNDDVFLSNKAHKEDFFTGSGCSVSFLEPYGMVIGETDPQHQDYFNAAINGRKLIEQRFERSPTQLHQHTPLVLRKSVLNSMEAEFPEAFTATRAARFRATTDISTVSFLYHHYALQLQEAVVGTCRAMLIKEDGHRDRFKQVLSPNDLQFFCINDGNNSTDNKTYLKEKVRTLTRLFPDPAPWEEAQ